MCILPCRRTWRDCTHVRTVTGPMQIWALPLREHPPQRTSAATIGVVCCGLLRFGRWDGCGPRQLSDRAGCCCWLARRMTAHFPRRGSAAALQDPSFPPSPLGPHTGEDRSNGLVLSPGAGAHGPCLVRPKPSSLPPNGGGATQMPATEHQLRRTGERATGRQRPAVILPFVVRRPIPASSARSRVAKS